MIKTKEFAKWLDDQTPWNKIIGGGVGLTAELADRHIYSGVMELAVSQIPEEYHNDVQSFLDGIVAGDLSKVGAVTTEFLVEILETPLGDERERILINGILDIILKLVALKEKDILSVASATVGGGGPSGNPEGGG